METNNISLVEQIKQLRDYVILDKKDYEKLVQNSKAKELDNSSSVIEALQANVKILEYDLEWCKGMQKYWKEKYETCLEELKKETTRWWRF